MIALILFFKKETDNMSLHSSTKNIIEKMIINKDKIINKKVKKIILVIVVTFCWHVILYFRAVLTNFKNLDQTKKE